MFRDLYTSKVFKYSISFLKYHKVEIKYNMFKTSPYRLSSIYIDNHKPKRTPTLYTVRAQVSLGAPTLQEICRLETKISDRQ